MDMFQYVYQYIAYRYLGILNYSILACLGLMVNIIILTKEIRQNSQRGLPLVEFLVSHWVCVCVFF